MSVLSECDRYQKMLEMMRKMSWFVVNCSHCSKRSRLRDLDTWAEMNMMFMISKYLTKSFSLIVFISITFRMWLWLILFESQFLRRRKKTFDFRLDDWDEDSMTRLNSVSSLTKNNIKVNGKYILIQKKKNHRKH